MEGSGGKTEEGRGVYGFFTNGIGFGGVGKTNEGRQKRERRSRIKNDDALRMENNGQKGKRGE